MDSLKYDTHPSLCHSSTLSSTHSSVHSSGSSSRTSSPDLNMENLPPMKQQLLGIFKGVEKPSEQQQDSETSNNESSEISLDAMVPSAESNQPLRESDQQIITAFGPSLRPLAASIIGSSDLPKPFATGGRPMARVMAKGYIKLRQRKRREASSTPSFGTNVSVGERSQATGSPEPGIGPAEPVTAMVLNVAMFEDHSLSQQRQRGEASDTSSATINVSVRDGSQATVIPVGYSRATEVQVSEKCQSNSEDSQSINEAYPTTNKGSPLTGENFQSTNEDSQSTGEETRSTGEDLIDWRNTNREVQVGDGLQTIDPLGSITNGPFSTVEVEGNWDLAKLR
ncbi:hypothetical protein B0T10DRAFT_458491 [Thelonectria olida]|uniref:Uncharacterized protein n=1 Tax=Thelonectria olida TaxID=1576542 RepID=A0A9P8W5S5_9HYPO|nr:hypothetical protein B0T10DRAFT_458491 [Thelonectria olida]